MIADNLPHNGPLKTAVIVDTGVWVYTTALLSTSLGAALLYAIRRLNFALMIPEILETEIRKHTVKRGMEAAAAIADHYRLIEILMGSRDDYQVPSLEDFTARVDARFNQLGDLLERLPFTLDHAKGAFLRIIDESPPNRVKDQQFKDSAVWEAIIELSSSRAVHFITEDKGFFEDRKPEKGVAHGLRNEGAERDFEIHVHYGPSAFLNAVVAEIPQVDQRMVADDIYRQLLDQLQKDALEKGFELGDLSNYEVQIFLTEDPATLAVEFELICATTGVTPPTETSVVEANLHVKGNCAWDLRHDEAKDLSLTEHGLLTPGGERIPGYGHTYIHLASAIMGRRTLPYRLREPLPDRPGQ